MDKKRKTLITSALPYANGSIHIGHLVEYIQSDIYARHLRQSGEDAIYICADDTHGTPIEINARQRGMKPEDLIAFYAKEHVEDFAAFDVRFDRYYTTNSPENKKYADLFFERLNSGGYVHRGPVRQYYCEKCGRFLPDRYVKGHCPKCQAPDQYGDVCEACNSTYTPTDLVEPRCATCGAEPRMRESNHYFFKLSAFGPWLREWLETNRVVQDEVRNSVMAWIGEGLRDWCISRDGPYFGFKIPGEEDKFYYVWLDAPIGYISSTEKYCVEKGLDVGDYWTSPDSRIIHFIGKDIVYFHILFWPAMLKAAGFHLPDTVAVHGMLRVNGEKMSKSRGTFITARQYLAKLDPQYLRYYYAANLTGKPEDIDLNLEDFANRINGELVGNLANFCYRVLSFCKTKLGGRLTSFEDGGLVEEVAGRVKAIRGNYDALDLRRAVKEICAVSDAGNRFFQEREPWALLRSDRDAAARVVTTAANMVKVIAVALKPVLPRFAASIEEQLGLGDLRWDDARFDLKDMEMKETKQLMPKVEKETVLGLTAAEGRQEQKAVEAAGPAGEVSLDEFKKIDLRVGVILEAEKVPKSEKIVKMVVDVGERRVMVAGIAKHYTPEQLVGKKVIIVANLKPARIMGIESRGMLLASGDDKRGLVVAEFLGDVKPGEKVR